MFEPRPDTKGPKNIGTFMVIGGILLLLFAYSNLKYHISDLSDTEVDTLLKNSNRQTDENTTLDDYRAFEQVNQEIWSLGAEVFIPAAASRLVTRMQLAQLLDNGLEIISSGANVPFADEEIFYGPIAEHADEKCAVIPDFISNCGMARVFGYLMEENAELTDTAIFHDVSQTILEALKDIEAVKNERVNITSKAYTNALKLLI